MTVIVGDVPAARAIAAAERVFGDWRGPASRRSPCRRSDAPGIGSGW